VRRFSPSSGSAASSSYVRRPSRRQTPLERPLAGPARTRSAAAIANEGAQFSQRDVQNVIDDADITAYVSAGAKGKT